jgi:ATP synthase F1 gamma subunit
MKRPQEIATEQSAMGTIVNLTGAFEGIASMRIAQTKNQVLKSQGFFNELWKIYSQLRVDSLFRFGRSHETSAIDKELFIAITAEGGFSGDIDQKLIGWMLKHYDKDKHDIIILGHHGAVQLTQAGISFKKYFKLPEKDQNINVAPLIAEVALYKNTSVFYQTYVSLMVQDIKRIELANAVQLAGGKADKSTDVISEKTYIFEPSTYDVVAHLESSMLEIALSQVILDSKLAQYASRFRAMTTSHSRAVKDASALRSSFYRTKRAVGDERLKETINGMRRGGNL